MQSSQNPTEGSFGPRGVVTLEHIHPRHPNPLLLAMFAREYYATVVPLAVQRAVLAPLVAIARRLGYEQQVRPSAGGPSAAAGAR